GPVHAGLDDGRPQHHAAGRPRLPPLDRHRRQPEGRQQVRPQPQGRVIDPPVCKGTPPGVPFFLRYRSTRDASLLELVRLSPGASRLQRAPNAVARASIRAICVSDRSNPSAPPSTVTLTVTP